MADIIDDEERIDDTIKDFNKGDSEPHQSLAKSILEYVRVVAIGALIAFLLCKFVIINATVPTTSMVSTINVNDRLIGLRLTYYFRSPERGEVVIFKCPNPDKDYNKLYVKRVIGLPGETVTIKAGQVYITGTDGTTFHLVEDYLNEEFDEAEQARPENNAEYVLGDDEYFMMGDNRNYSYDSRFWGNVTEDRILAKVVWKYYKGFKVFD